MIATDPLSLVFVICIVFSGAYLILTNLLGLGHGHGFQIGGDHVHLDVGGNSGVHHVAGHGGNGHGVSTTHDTGVSHSQQPPPQGSRVELPHAQGDAPSSGVLDGPLSLARLISGLNLSSVLTFIFCFGLLGYLLHNTAHAGAFVAISVGGIVGLLMALAVNLLYLRLFGEGGGRLSYGSSQMEGRIARVSMPIRVGGLGEIILIGENGSRTSMGARSANDMPIALDADVVIVEYRDGVARVETWDAFLANTDALSEIKSPQ